MAQFKRAFWDRAASALRAWVRRNSHGMFAIDSKASVRRIALWAICAITLMGSTILFANVQSTRAQESSEIAKQAQGATYQIAQIYAWRGETDRALDWLERAYAQKDVNLSYIKVDLALKNLDSDPRFKALLRKMNLPE